MGTQDFQLGVKSEVTYGTAVTVDRFFEYDSESISETYGRTEGDPLRVGSGFRRSDRHTPYIAGASGSVTMAVLTKGFGFWLPHMMGAVATTGPAETTAYTHTGTEATLYGDSFTLQVNRPFNPAGTNQAFTYAGGKVTNWALRNSTDENLLLELGVDFASVATGTALATASYPTGMENLTWAGGLVTIAGDAYDVSEIAIECDNGYPADDGRQIRRNTQKKERANGGRSATFSLTADFESLTQRNRAAATARADNVVSLVASWRGPTLLGTTIYPSLTVTCTAARFDTWEGATEGRDAIMQNLSGEIRWDGTNSPIELEYVSADSTA